MNTREIAEKIVRFFLPDPMPAEVDAIQSIIDRHLEGKVLMPKHLLYHMRDLALGRDPKCAEIRAMIAEAEKS